jgi:hypothetical protein
MSFILYQNRDAKTKLSLNNQRDDLLNSNKTCFVISPIGDETSATRRFSDLTFNYIIRPVVKKYGYNLNRADMMGKPGTIMSHIAKQVLDSNLVIADLTNWNPNVFYELAIRHITGKPCVQMIKRGQKPPFDIQGIDTVFFDIDLENAEDAKNQLEKQIKLIEKGEFNITNPITPIQSHPLIIQALQESKRDLNDNEILASILETLNNLSYETIWIQREISSLKESRNYIGNLGNKRLNFSLNNFDPKHDLNSINQELFLLTNIKRILDRNIEEIEERAEIGESWEVNEAIAERGVIENRIEFLNNVKNNLEKVEGIN